MNKYFLEKAFIKAGKICGKESVNARAEYLSEYILKEHKYSISTKSLSRYYKGESSPNREVQNYLAQFLEYENYEDYIIHNSETLAAPEDGFSKMPERGEKFSRKNLLLFLFFIPVMGISAYVGYISGEEECMQWTGTNYIATSCSGDPLEKQRNPVLLKNFRKIEVSDTTTFFKNGEVQVWYDKSNNKLEFFTAPGIHPENGKTLKPVSQYIIKKYVRD